MNNNRKYVLTSTIYLGLLEFLMFNLFGYGIYYFMVFTIGVPKELVAFQYASIAVFMSLVSIPISWTIFFLTISKIYKKLGASFSFKHPVLFTSIIIFVLGNILFYLSMLVWTLLT